MFVIFYKHMFTYGTYNPHGKNNKQFLFIKKPFMKSNWVQVSFYFGKMFISGITQSSVPPLKLLWKPFDNKVQEPCLSRSITHWIITSFKIIKKKKFKSPNLVVPLAWKNKSPSLHTTLFCWTMKIIVPFYYFHWSTKIFTNLSPLLQI